MFLKQLIRWHTRKEALKMLLSGMHWTWYSLGLFASSLTVAAPTSINLSFQAQPGSTSSLTGRLSGSSPQTATTDYLGTIEANVQFDPVSLQASGIHFTGGAVAPEDFSLTFSGLVTVPRSGMFFTIVSVNATDIEQSLSTLNPPGAVFANDQLDLAPHRVTTDRGILEVTATVPAFNASETDRTNFTQNPETEVLDGSASLTVIEETADVLERSLLFVLEWSASETTEDLIEDTTTSIILQRDETLIAHARTTIPTGYGQWALDNDLSLSDAFDLNQAGLPYALTYAFSLPPESGVLPIRLLSGANAPPTIEITLPSGGLRMPLTARYSQNLAPGSWAPLAETLLTGGSNTLDLGSTGVVEARFPAGSTGFMRFAADL